RTSNRNLLTSRILEPTLKSGDKVGRPDIEEKEMQYLYKEGDHYVFMDVKTYDQLHVGVEALKEGRNFLKENMNAHILFWNGRAISAELPNTVELKVTRCDPGVRGDTGSGAMKPASVEAGYTLNVRLFMHEGE